MKHVWHECRAVAVFILLKAALSVEPQIVEEVMTLRAAGKKNVEGVEVMLSSTGRGA